MVEVGDCVLVELEDVTRGYRRPSIVDIKVRPRLKLHTGPKKPWPLSAASAARPSLAQ